MKSQEQAQTSSSQSNQQSATTSSSGASNAQQASQLQNVGNLEGAFGLIVSGQIAAAKDAAHRLADQGRQHNDNQLAQWAGKVWTVADSFQQIQKAIASQSMSSIQGLASHAADLTRALIGAGQISANDGQRILDSAGGYWNLAKQSTTIGAGGSGASGGASGGAANKAKNSEVVEQHKLPSSRNWAYCGIATTMMMLKANGKNGNVGEMNQLVSEMYHSGDGTDVDGMASALRKRGLNKAQSTRSGTFTQLISTLKAGQPVPFGITHSTGTIVKMNSNKSKHYAHYRPGDRHYRKFGSSGHWVLVVGFEGSAEKPTHFIINDPDLGGQLRATKSELESMGVGNGQFFQVYQK